MTGGSRILHVSAICTGPTALVCGRYGVKMEALALLQEWVRDVGGQAGFTTQNTRIFSGAIGSPESRLEVPADPMEPLKSPARLKSCTEPGVP